MLKKKGDVSVAQVSVFSSPLVLGFEHFANMVDEVSKKSADGYPPYNIEETSDRRLRITLAVAGFSKVDLSVELRNNQLEIRGQHVREQEPGVAFLHKGIATRQFRRTFVLADGIEVISADLHNGLLSLNLERPEPEVLVRNIEIRTHEQNRASTLSIKQHSDQD